MLEDVIKVCVDKFFTSEEENQEAAKKAIEENPLNSPEHTDALRPLQVGVDLADVLRPAELAGITGKKWRPGRTIRVLFLDGDPGVQSKVKDYAQQWERYANINFEFGSDSDAEIRISFEFDPGRSWSYLGTDALARPVGEPTMNYGWLTPQSEEQEYSRVVIHEFGHALACVHEHQNPAAGISWNKPAVYRYYEESGWTKEMVDNNIFRRYGRTRTQFSAYDRSSIMHYAIPSELVLDPNDAVGWNTQLSTTDKQFVGQLYAF
jgi:hypothetical protein